jgi:hypothetical protein
MFYLACPQANGLPNKKHALLELNFNKKPALLEHNLKINVFDCEPQ